MTTILELIRHEESHEWGTFGILKIDKQVFCVTLERPDNLNAPFIGSIPAQQYLCKRYNSPKFGSTWQVKDVPGRTYILFHPANLVDQLEGCIALAQYWGKIKGDRAILNSGNTFKEFMRITKDEDVLHLTIKEVY